MKPVKIKKVEEWKIEKILNKRKVRGSHKVFGTVERVYSRV